MALLPTSNVGGRAQHVYILRRGWAYDTLLTACIFRRCRHRITSDVTQLLTLVASIDDRLTRQPADVCNKTAAAASIRRRMQSDESCGRSSKPDTIGLPRRLGDRRLGPGSPAAVRAGL